MADRITHVPAEVPVVPDTQKARVTQVPAEVPVVPNTQKARVTEVPVEVAIYQSVVTGAVEPFRSQIIG
jgi:hypothetical protein